MLNLEVVRADGNRPALGPLVLRFLVRFPMVVGLVVPVASKTIPLIFMGIQGIAAAAGVASFFFASGRTLSDLLTGTRVVYRFDGFTPAAGPGATVTRDEAPPGSSRTLTRALP
jgi:uncharacterized RDD family membrane protein YckC